MPSTRSKLVLDEESFQGLLAAAFTIQQYNDKQGGIEAALSAELTGTIAANGVGGKNAAAVNATVNGDRDKVTATNGHAPAATAAELCPQCGAPLLAAGIPCAACDGEVFRPGERLQRTWATMWSLSQEQGSFPLGPLPGETVPAKPGLVSAAGEAPGGLVVTPVAREVGAVDDAGVAVPIDINAVAVAVAAAGGSLGPRLRVRFQRADLYLGLSVLVALVALLWPTASAGRAELSPWERVLVAVGIAEEPTSEAEVHYAGDPNIKVWVDTQAALYYCPGDELYGKSPGGHYTTQHDAQLDRFEPALRRACVP